MTALLGDADFAFLDALRRAHYPLDRNRVPAHLTLFSQLPPSLEPELDRRLAASTSLPAPRARLAGVMDLGSGTAFRVESRDLGALREQLAESFHGMLTPQDRAPWNAHVTIQNKVDPREARQLQARLHATFEPRSLAIRGLTSWRYQAGLWDRIKNYVFRG